MLNLSGGHPPRQEASVKMVIEDAGKWAISSEGQFKRVCAVCVGCGVLSLPGQFEVEEAEEDGW